MFQLRFYIFHFYLHFMYS